MSDDLGLVLFTLRIAALSTLVLLPFGIATAFGLARWRWPGRSVIDTLLSLPLVLPPTAVGLLLLQALSPVSWTGEWLASAGIDVVFTWKGALVAAAVMSFPLMVRPARAAFEDVDLRLVGLARTLGCGPARAFFRVTLPLAWRGVLAGAVLSFARALGEFGATIMLAGNIPGRTQTLALAIFQAEQTGDLPRARALVAVTVALAFVTLWAAEWFTRAREKNGRR